MECSFGKSVLFGIATMSMAFALNATVGFAQEVNSSDSSDEMTFDIAAKPPTKQCKKHNPRKRAFVLGVCVGQTLLAANPPVPLPVGKKPTKDQIVAIKAASKACIAAFKAARPKPGKPNNGNKPALD